MAGGSAAGIAALERIEANPALARYYLLLAALGGLWLKRGDPARAAHHYGDALTRSCSAPERRFLEKQPPVALSVKLEVTICDLKIRAA